MRIQDLRTGHEVCGYYLLKNIAFKNFKDGSGQFVNMILSDKTGDIDAVCFNNVNADLQAGDVVYIRGVTQIYSGKLQIKVDEISKTEKDATQYQQVPPNYEDNLDKFNGVLNSMQDSRFASVVNSVFSGETLQLFQVFPAAVNNHHAYYGGLMEHTLGVVNLVKTMKDFYMVDGDLLLAGAMLHDIGKIYEYNNIGKTFSGDLLGHIYFGAELVSNVSGDLNKTDADLLLHLILSHHGKGEWGSPVEPATPEAEMLHYVDMIDSRMNMYFADGSDDHILYSKKLNKKIFLP